MTNEQLERLKYPVGRMQFPDTLSTGEVDNYIATIEQFPTQLKLTIKDLGATDLDWAYRPGGWTIKEVIHHCADSHMNAFIRFKLALTEDKPTIKPYFEDRWAKLMDTTNVDISYSISLLEGLHFRWTILLKSMQKADFERSFIHPEHSQEISLYTNLYIYDWHCRHHLAHVKQAVENGGL